MAVPIVALHNIADVELEWLDAQIPQELLEGDSKLWSYHALLAQLRWWSARILRTLPGLMTARRESYYVGSVMRRLDVLAARLAE